MDKDDEVKKERRYYTSGPGEPPISIQAILYEKKISVIDFFHLTDTYLDWEKQKDDIAVVEPLATLLVAWGDDLILVFHGTVTELLYSLDVQKVIRDTYKGRGFSASEFSYIRCIALVSSKRYYSDVVSDRRKLKGNLPFGSILSIPAFAQARVHGKPENERSHIIKYYYETMSSTEGQKGEAGREG